MTIYAGAVVPPLDSMWLLTRDRTAIIYVPRDPDFIYRATTGNNYAGVRMDDAGRSGDQSQARGALDPRRYDPILKTGS